MTRARSFDFRKHVIGVLAVLGCLFWAYSVNQVGPIREVDVPAARELINQGALVIDVRGPDAFEFRHIPGAVLITLDELRAGIPAKLAAVATERPIVVYCNEGTNKGPKGTELLNKHGFANAVNLKSGIEGWSAAGQPMTPKKDG